MHATPVLSHIGIGRNFDHTFVKNFILISMIRVNVIIIYHEEYEPNSIFCGFSRQKKTILELKYL